MVQLIKLGLPSAENVVSTDKFVVNKILPVMIKSTDIKQRFLILFKAMQDYDDSSIFLQIMVNVDDPRDCNFFYEHFLHWRQIYKSEQRKAQVMELLDGVDDNLYGTDFDLKLDEDYGDTYYHCQGVRAVSNKKAKMMDVYFTRDNYLKMKIYLDRLSLGNKNNVKDSNESVFLNSFYENMRYVLIDHIKYDASTTVPALQVDISHYTFNCGPTCYKANFMSPIPKDATSLKNPLDSNLFNTFYKNDPLITDVVVDDDFVYVFISIMNVLTNKQEPHATVLKIDHEKIKVTNILNIGNIYIGRGEK